MSARQIRSRRQVDLRDSRSGKRFWLPTYAIDRTDLGVELTLHADAVLIAGWLLVFVDGQAGDARRVDRQAAACRWRAEIRILERDTGSVFTWKLNGMFGPALYMSLP